jgi:3-oxoacyl-ACP reductase-like protein
MSVNEYMADISAEAEKRIAIHKEYYLQVFNQSDPLKSEAARRAYQEFSSSAPAQAPAAVAAAATAAAANPADINAEIDRLMGLLPIKERAAKMVGYAQGIVYSESMGVHTGLGDFMVKVNREKEEAAYQKAADASIEKLRAEKARGQAAWG